MKDKKEGLHTLLFLLPALLIYSCVIILPALYSFFISFFRWDGVTQRQFVGLKNYTNLFIKDAIFIGALKNNIIWVLLTIGITVILALFLALAMNRAFKFRVMYRAVFYFPYMLSWIIAGLIWKWIYNPNFGLIGAGMTALGIELESAVLSDSRLALYAVFAAALWQGVGQPMLYFLAGLQTLPSDMLEAAKVDGAGKLALFFHMIVPLLKETFVIVIATQIISSLKVYDIILVMTGGGPANATQTLATYMYNQTFTYNNYGQGSAIAMIMVVIMMGIIIPYIRFTSKEH